MSTGKIFSVYKDLPNWAKGVVIVGGLGVTYIFVSQVISIIKKDAQSKSANASVDAAKNEIQAEISKGNSPSYSDSDYLSWANQLKAAFDGYGTDVPTIMNVFNLMKKDIDILKLKVAYGVREISSGNWNPSPNFTGDLAATLSDELNSREMNTLNLSLNRRGLKQI